MRKLQLIMAMVVVLFLSGCVNKSTSNIVELNLEIHVIDVGQADSIYFKLPNGQDMLIDAGNNLDGDLVVDYLTANDVNRIDYVIGTHPHEDHIGGLDKVIGDFKVSNIYLPDKTPNTKTYEDLLDVIRAKNLIVTIAKEGVVLFDTVVNAKILKAVMLSPISDSYSNTNNYSPIIKLIYGDTAYIFTGDAEIEVEEELLDNNVNLLADVLKIGHHGSITSTSQAFLDAVNPKIAIISVGQENPYGHPNQETLDKLTKKNIDIYRTDEDGTIIVKSDGTSINIEKISDNSNIITTEPTNLIYINEILPSPSNGKKEWVEIFNPTGEPIDISGYIIDDIDGGSSPKTIPDETIIDAEGYYVYYLSSGIFNNNGDDVRLFTPSKLLVDSYTYGDTDYDESWYRESDGGNWSTTPTTSPTPNNSNS